MLSFFGQTRRWLACSLAVILAANLAHAQTPAAPQPAMMRTLKVIALAGNGEMNDLEKKVMAPLVVDVLDQNDRPVEGADVTFRFPPSGPSATFADQKSAATFRTNADGEAAAIGWMANSQTGTFKIQVTAIRGLEDGTAVISMTNAAHVTEAAARVQNKKWWSRKSTKIIIIAVVAAAAATAIVLATRGSGTKTVTAIPGSPTIGAPQ